MLIGTCNGRCRSSELKYEFTRFHTVLCRMRTDKKKFFCFRCFRLTKYYSRKFVVLIQHSSFQSNSALTSLMWSMRPFLPLYRLALEQCKHARNSAIFIFINYIILNVASASSRQDNFYSLLENNQHFSFQ